MGAWQFLVAWEEESDEWEDVVLGWKGPGGEGFALGLRRRGTPGR